jgi:hypothetical protein
MPRTRRSLAVQETINHQILQFSSRVSHSAFNINTWYKFIPQLFFFGSKEKKDARASLLIIP